MMPKAHAVLASSGCPGRACHRVQAQPAAQPAASHLSSNRHLHGLMLQARVVCVMGDAAAAAGGSGIATVARVVHRGRRALAHGVAVVGRHVVQFQRDVQLGLRSTRTQAPAA